MPAPIVVLAPPAACEAKRADIVRRIGASPLGCAAVHRRRRLPGIHPPSDSRARRRPSAHTRRVRAIRYICAKPRPDSLLRRTVHVTQRFAELPTYVWK